MIRPLFDFDGVIVNTFDICHEISASLQPDRTLAAEEYRGYFDGNIYDVVDEKEKDTFGQLTAVSKDDPFHRLYVPKLMRLAPVPGMIDLLGRLSASVGQRKFPVVSSSVSSVIDCYLVTHGVRDLFGTIYGADVHKSKRVKLRRALADAGVSADDAVFITDTLGDIREAAHVGLRAIGVTWGFQRAETLRRGNPLAVVDTAEELYTAIGQS
ncbi:MAG: HAD hydrolase-like protein [Patescibacteria group bacterium]